MKRFVFSALLALCSATAPAQVADEYTLTDISGWTSNQLAALPYFDRYVPIKPSGATGDFSAQCRNGFGVIVGNRSTDETGAYAQTNSQADIPAWGTYHWSYWIWDGRDNHYYWGSVTKSPAKDVNVFGQIVGYSTMPGGGSGVNSSSQYDTHGYLRDAATGEHLDLTPGAHRADFRGINDHGEITGIWSTSNASHAVRRLADGTEYDFASPGGSVSPAVINNRGIIAGSVVTYGVPWVYHLFVSTETNAMTQLPYPPQGSPENGTLYDVNDHGMIVGQVYKGSGIEKQAARWYPEGEGWGTDDLNELLADNPDDFLLDRAIAVNDAGHIIVKAHPDADVIVTHTLLLTPNVFPKPSVITLDAVSVTHTSTVIRAKINACNLATTGGFQYGTTPAYGAAAVLSGTFTGTAPALVSTTLTNLTPNTTYHFRAAATNAQGETLGEDIAFTTQYDYATWATEQFGSNATNPAVAGPLADGNTNGINNLTEYALANNGRISGAIASNRFSTTYTRLADRGDITYTVECTTNLLGQWQSGPANVEILGVITNPDGTKTVTARCVAPISNAPQQFLRVRIIQTP